jgi:hypothetical protein
VSFYLFLYQSGRLGQIDPEMRDEVRKAFWFPLDKAHRKLTYRGEREVLKMAQKIVREHPERLTPPPPKQLASGPAVERPAAQQRSASQRINWQACGPAQPRGGQPHGASQPRGPAQHGSNETRPSPDPGSSGGSRAARSYHKER